MPHTQRQTHDCHCMHDFSCLLFLEGDTSTNDWQTFFKKSRDSPKKTFNPLKPVQHLKDRKAQDIR
jgi:hypothetical protein